MSRGRGEQVGGYLAGAKRGDCRQVGPIGQKTLLKSLRILVDTASAKGASKTRDDARRTLRAVLDTCNWRTPFILQNIAAKRCRFISSMGYVVDIKWLSAQSGDVERLSQSGVRNG